MPSGKHLRALPSVLDLPSMVEFEVDAVSTAPNPRIGRRDLKVRLGRVNGSATHNGRAGKMVDIAPVGLGLEELGGKGGDVDVVKHHDADGK